MASTGVSTVGRVDRIPTVASVRPFRSLAEAEAAGERLAAALTAFQEQVTPAPWTTVRSPLD